MYDPSVSSFDQSRSFKLAIFGETMVGKSALICRFLYKKFKKEYTSTVEDKYNKKI
jgi:GTPase SAR1 family protein